MEWMTRIKAGVGQYVLNHKLKSQKRRTVVCNIKDAKSIGIIYNATALTSFEIIKELARKITDNNATASILGYVHSKNLIDHYLYRKGFDFFYKGDLNWYGRPSSEVTARFMSEPFDILINLSLENLYPIQYITALSPAGFKAGRYSADDTFLDLMIDIEKEKTMMKTLKDEITADVHNRAKKTELEIDVEKKTETEMQLAFLINQLMHYLAIINNK